MTDGAKYKIKITNNGVRSKPPNAGIIRLNGVSIGSVRSYSVTIGQLEESGLNQDNRALAKTNKAKIRQK
jgi:hypothetical protein